MYTELTNAVLVQTPTTTHINRSVGNDLQSHGRVDKTTLGIKKPQKRISFGTELVLKKNKFTTSFSLNIFTSNQNNTAAIMPSQTNEDSDFAMIKKIDKKKRKSGSTKDNRNAFPVYIAPAFGCISPDNPCRRKAIKLVHSQSPFICAGSCTFRTSIFAPCVKCGLIQPKGEVTVASFASLMHDKPKPVLLDRKISFLWTFDRTIITLILMNCLFLSMTNPFPTCCQIGVESHGESTSLITASFFATDLGTIRTDNTGLGNSIAMINLQKETPSGNKTAVRCVMGGETMSNVLHYRNELIEDTPVQWHKTTIPCCVNRNATGIVPMEGVDVPTKCADWDESYTAFVFNWAFTICFTVEMCIQFLARGWCGDKPNKKKLMPGGYFTSSWFILDFVVVVVSFLSEIPGVGNVSALRTFRVLRPLRTLTAIPSMRALINSLFKSLPNMQYVVMMMLFLPIVFGVVAVTLWGGLLRGQCHYYDSNASEWLIDDFQEGRFCALKNLPVTPEKYNNQTRPNDYYNIGRLCGDRFYGNDSWSIVNNTMDCIAAKNPNYGETHFETIGVAMLWIFADITLEGWVDNMYMINDVFSDRSEPVALFVNMYFTLMVLLGGFFMLNLALAVVWDNYQKESQAADAAIQDSLKLEKMQRDRNILFRWKRKATLKRKRRETRLLNENLTSQVVGSLHEAGDKTATGKDGEDGQDEQDGKDKKSNKIVVGTPNVNRKFTSISKPPAAFNENGHPTGFTMKRTSVDAGSSIFAIVGNHKKSADDAKQDIYVHSCRGCVVGWISHLVRSGQFSAFITLCILLNVLFMAMDYSTPETSYYTPADYIRFLYWANESCSVVFLMELVLKLIGIGWTEYASDNFNLFDMAIVCFSVFEWLLLWTGGGIAVSGLSVFRLFRVMRILKLAKSWKELNNLIRLIALSVGDVTSAAFLLLVIMFIFSMIGMQLFGGQWDAEIFLPDDPPRANFDEFGWSLVTVFQVLSGENWNDVLWAGMKASGAPAAMYFLALNIGGGFIILNLFLAILLARFEGPDNDVEEEEEEDKGAESIDNERRKSIFDEDEDHDGNGNTKNTGKNQTKVHPASKQASTETKTTVSPKRFESAELDIDRMTLPQRLSSKSGRTLVRTKSVNFNSLQLSAVTEKPPEQEYLEDNIEMSGTSLGVLGTDSSIRALVFRLISNKKFEGFILFLIGISSLMLAMDEPWVETCACFDPNDPATHYAACDTTLNGKLFNAALGAIPGNSRPYLEFLLYSDLIITIIFVIEMVLKMIGLGIIRSKTAYFKSGWNTLDFFIVIISVVGLFTGPLMTGICIGKKGGGGILKALRSMRALRALRPLRVVRRYPALRLVVSSIFRAGPAIANVLIVMTLFFLIFAIYGSQRWMGQMAACNDGDVDSFEDCNGDFLLTGTLCSMLPTPQLAHDCLMNGDAGSNFTRRWESFPANFDHVGNGFLTVFELASGEMWPDIMYYTVDAVAINTSQIENWNRGESAIFHILVQLVCSFLMVNVFIGVVIEKYNENKKKSEGGPMLTSKQLLWLESMKLALSGNAIRQDVPPKQYWRVCIFYIVKHPFFDGFIMFCIVSNTIVLMCSSFDEGIEKEFILETLNFMFSLIFSVEFVLKFTGLGRQYFYTRWNNFDFILVVLSWAGVAFTIGPIASLFRVFRVLRMVRLVRTQKGLLNLFKTLIFSLPALANISAIVVLFMFVFSCIAMNLFANVKLQDNLSDAANFQTFFRSFNTLWRYIHFLFFCTVLFFVCSF